MAKGAVAKEKVEEIIIKAFGDNYIGTQDKKLYVWANDGGEMVQIAISLTCPKNSISAVYDGASSGDLDFTEENTISKPEEVEITEKEKQNLADLLAKFGI